ncbi:hypothetical protein KSP39_PZI008401 [Platanthera zijinensis]|uniref:Uncharacterized protein n=1 Tax=Platanthera zijinensis TaxID=2320716 RepID=A0AAP0BLJ8_9ASPA
MHIDHRACGEYQSKSTFDGKIFGSDFLIMNMVTIINEGSEMMRALRKSIRHKSQLCGAHLLYSLLIDVENSYLKISPFDDMNRRLDAAGKNEKHQPSEYSTQ